VDIAVDGMFTDEAHGFDVPPLAKAGPFGSGSDYYFD
jgi:hypothetical protein